MPITGTAGNDSLVGTSGNDVIQGLGGHDTLVGNDGDDSLSGGDGNDSLVAGNGWDVLFGGDGNDTLDGGAGGDTLYGGAGIDTYYVDSLDDYAYDDTANPNSVRSTISYDLSTHTSGIRNLFLLGTSAINATGDAGDNGISGNDGANVLNGGAGHDLIFGNGGNDTIDGGTGDDTLDGGAGADLYYVDSSYDEIWDDTANTNTVYSSADYFSLADQAGAVKNALLLGTGDIDLEGNALDNKVFGNSGVNAIYGGDGLDELYGFDGNDTLSGDAGDDYLVGGNGVDLILGGTGSDVLIGEAGGDILNGQGGNDWYEFSSGFGADVVVDNDTVSGNSDEAHFLSSDYNSLWFKQVGSSLEISVVGASDKVTVQNWFNGANNQIELIFDDVGSHKLAAANVAGLVSALAAFSPQNLSGNATLTAARDAAWVAA